MSNFAMKNVQSGRTVKEGLEFTDKQKAKAYRDDLNKEYGFIKYCVTRTETNKASKPPHGRPCSYRGLT